MRERSYEATDHFPCAPGFTQRGPNSSSLPEGAFAAARKVVKRGTSMQQVIKPTEISFDAYTLCSFMPTLDVGRAVPLVLIGYRTHEEPSFVWLVPKEGVPAHGLTDDPYYAKVLSDPRTYFTKNLSKYIEESGSVKRGIEMLIDCHQNHLAFTPLTHLDESPFRHPLELALVSAF